MARNIEALAINDIDSAAGIQFAMGHTDNNPANTLAATTDPSLASCTLTASLADGSNSSCGLTTASEPYFGTGNNFSQAWSSGGQNRSQMRTHVLSNANLIWDLSGNVYEFVDQSCDTSSWYASGWVEWNNANLTDWEVKVAGPAGALTSANGAGQYYACTNNGINYRGGSYWETTLGGIYASAMNWSTTDANLGVGFRCAYQP